jgi:hypothetical protein
MRLLGAFALVIAFAAAISYAARADRPGPDDAVRNTHQPLEHAARAGAWTSEPDAGGSPPRPDADPVPVDPSPDASAEADAEVWL